MKPPSNDPNRTFPGKPGTPQGGTSGPSGPNKDQPKPAAGAPTGSATATAGPLAGRPVVTNPGAQSPVGPGAGPKPAEWKPADGKPAQGAGPDTKVAEAKVPDSKPSDVKPSDAKPGVAPAPSAVGGVPKPTPTVTSPAAATLGGGLGKAAEPGKAPDTPKSAGVPESAPVGATIPGGAKPDLAKPDLAKPDPVKAEPGKPEAGKPDPLKLDQTKSGPGQTGTGKPDAAKVEPPHPGSTSASGPQGALRSGPSGSDGPIIDLAAKRVPPTAATTGETTKDSAAKDAARAAGKEDAARSATVPAAARGPGFGSVAAAGLLGGVIGAGLLFAVERAGLSGENDAEKQVAALDQRLATLAPRDAVAALDKRVAANEAALKPLPDAVRSAESNAKQALDKAAAPAAAPAPSGDGSAPAPAAALPPDITARLDALDQRVSALQEEPGREQPAEAKGEARATAGDAGGGQVAALAERLKALEGKAEAAGTQPDFAAQIASLRGDLEARAKADSDAEKALGQRVDGLQQALDQRVKAATEAVQTATQASREAAEAGRTQAQEATKAVERQMQEQRDQIAALDKAVAGRASAGALQAALRVVAAGRIAAALQAGSPYAAALDGLRNQAPGEPAQLAALVPFAEKGAPTSDALAAAFRPVAERIAARTRAAQARSVAETGDIKQRFLSMATSIVQVRKVDAPAAAPGGEPATDGDPTAKVQAALDRGDLPGAEQAFQAMPEDARTEAAEFGSRLKARVEAGRAADALLAEAFRALPAEPGR